MAGGPPCTLPQTGRPASPTGPWQPTTRAAWNGAPYATAIRSVEREQRLEELLADGTGVSGILEALQRPPLYATRFHHGFGTLYTAEYRPADRIARYHWPRHSWEQSLNNIKPRASNSNSPPLAQRHQRHGEPADRAALAVRTLRVPSAAPRSTAALTTAKIAPCRAAASRISGQQDLRPAPLRIGCLGCLVFAGNDLPHLPEDHPASIPPSKLISMPIGLYNSLIIAFSTT